MMTIFQLLRVSDCFLIAGRCSDETHLSLQNFPAELCQSDHQTRWTEIVINTAPDTLTSQ